MTWELIVSAILTAIAVITATVTIIYFLWRRYKKAKAFKRIYQMTPHINSGYCRCYWCKLAREQSE